MLLWLGLTLVDFIAEIVDHFGGKGRSKKNWDFQQKRSSRHSNGFSHGGTQSLAWNHSEPMSSLSPFPTHLSIVGTCFVMGLGMALCAQGLQSIFGYLKTSYNVCVVVQLPLLFSSRQNHLGAYKKRSFVVIGTQSNMRSKCIPRLWHKPYQDISPHSLDSNGRPNFHDSPVNSSVLRAFFRLLS